MQRHELKFTFSVPKFLNICFLTYLTAINTIFVVKCLRLIITFQIDISKPHCGFVCAANNALSLFPTNHDSILCYPHISSLAVFNATFLFMLYLIDLHFFRRNFNGVVLLAVLFSHLFIFVF